MPDLLCLIQCATLSNPRAAVVLIRTKYVIASGSCGFYLTGSIVLHLLLRTVRIRSRRHPLQRSRLVFG
jgi:hypothetical protein